MEEFMLKYGGKSNSERSGMKHKLTVVVSVVAVAGAGIYAHNLNHNYGVQQTRVDSVIQAQKEQTAQAAADKQAQFQSGVKKNEAQCVKDQAAYSALTSVQKAKTVAPDCEARLIQ